jgi:hypothetical protein
MKGTMLVYRPSRREPEITEFTSEPQRSHVEAAVGGRLEQVTGFFSIEYEGIIRRCVAFCVKDGKSMALSLNVAATVLWNEALRREMGVGLMRPDGTRADYLVGSVAVLFTE